MLIYDQPRSPGVANALSRVRHMVDLRWTPVQEVTLFPRKGTNGYYVSARTGKAPADPTPMGIPYSSSRILDKFVGVDISFDTFLSAVSNPASIVYTRDLSDFDDPVFNPAIRNVFFPYGTVCSAFADYVLDLPVHRCTHEWDTSPEFYEILPRSVDALALLDCLLERRSGAPTRTGSHVRVVSGIARDEHGKVQLVEISEGVTSSPRSRWFSREEMELTLTPQGKDERIFRCRYVDSVRPPAPPRSLSQAVIPDLGDWSNYHQGQPVELNITGPADTLILESDQTHLEIPISDLAPTTILGNEYTIYRTAQLAPGRYRAWCVRDGRPVLPAAHFIVVGLPDVTLTDVNGTSFPVTPFRLTDPEGKPLTEQSACFYKEDGTLNDAIVTLAITDGKRILPARAAVRQREGGLVLRLCAGFADAQGNPVRYIKVGEEVTLYAPVIPEHTVVRAAFSGAVCCTPSYYSVVEEAVVAYDQRLLCGNELQEGVVDITTCRHGNDFGSFMIFCENEYGRVCTEPIPFVFG